MFYIFKYINQGVEISIPDIYTLQKLLDESAIDINSQIYDEENDKLFSVSEIINNLNSINNNDNENGTSILQIPQEFHQEKNDEKRNFKMYIAPIIILVFANLITVLKVIITNNGEFRGKDISYYSGYIFGSILFNLIIIAIFWAIIWALTRSKKRTKGFLLFSIIFIVFSFFSLVSSISTIVEEQKKEELAKNKLIEIWENAASGNKIEKIDISKNEFGDFTPEIIFTQDFFSDSYNLSMTYKNELQKYNISQMFSPEKISNNEELSSSRRLLSNLLEFIDKYKINLKQMVLLYQTKVNDLDLPNNTKQGFIKGFLESSNSSMNQIESYYDIERKIISKADKAIEFLENNIRNYEIQNGQILFKNGSDADQYNKLIDELKSAANEETDFQANAKDIAKKSINDLKVEDK